MSVATQDIDDSPAAAARLPPAPIRFRRAAEADRGLIEQLQLAAYSRERLLGLEPPPLKADYADVLTNMEVWLAEERELLRGVLILDVRPGDLQIWSIAAAPDAQGQGLGQIMLDAAEVRAGQIGRKTIRLNMGSAQRSLVGWYSRHGYTVEATELIDARQITHMIKHLSASTAK